MAPGVERVENEDVAGQGDGDQESKEKDYKSLGGKSLPRVSHCGR